MTLAARRILVVGASSGIGRAVALSATAAGAQVVFGARRADRLKEAVEEAGGGTAIVADVRRPDDCERLVGEAVETLGGLDVLMYCAGITSIARLVDADSEHWRRIFETNVFGAQWVTRAALPHLLREASEPVGGVTGGGLAAYLSSNSVARPRPGLVAYSASKAALDEAILGWRTEHPELRFLRIIVGPTIGTDAARDYDLNLVGDLFRQWTAQAFMTEKMMQADDLGQLIAEVLSTVLAHPEIAMQDLRLEPPGPIQQLDAGEGSEALVEAVARQRDRAFAKADAPPEGRTRLRKED